MPAPDDLLSPEARLCELATSSPPLSCGTVPVSAHLRPKPRRIPRTRRFHALLTCPKRGSLSLSVYKPERRKERDERLAY